MQRCLSRRLDVLGCLALEGAAKILIAGTRDYGRSSNSSARLILDYALFCSTDLHWFGKFPAYFTFRRSGMVSRWFVALVCGTPELPGQLEDAPAGLAWFERVCCFSTALHGDSG